MAARGQFSRCTAIFRCTLGSKAIYPALSSTTSFLILQDGRALPADYHQFDHGYAITAHRSQGKTVDGVILLADAREQLRESLGISSARPSATELAREQSHLPQPEHKIQQAPVQQIEPPVPRPEISVGHNFGMGH
jgi:hypothetical protein